MPVIKLFSGEEITKVQDRDKVTTYLELNNLMRYFHCFLSLLCEQPAVYCNVSYCLPALCDRTSLDSYYRDGR